MSKLNGKCKGVSAARAMIRSLLLLLEHHLSLPFQVFFGFFSTGLLRSKDVEMDLSLMIYQYKRRPDETGANTKEVDDRLIEETETRPDRDENKTKSIHVTETRENQDETEAKSKHDQEETETRQR